VTQSAEQFQHAIASFQQGRLAHAEALCTELLQAHRDHAGALHLCGLLASRAGNYDRAIELIRRSLAIQQHQPVAHLNLANALLAAGKPRAALKSCEAAVLQRPDYAEALNTRANALRALSRPLEALAVYEQVLLLRPRLAIAHCNRAQVLRELQRAEEALASYRQALLLEPALREAVLGAGDTLLALGRPEDARICCEELLIRSPQDTGALQLQARTFRALNQPSAALADLERATALRPDVAVIALEHGNVLFQLERFADALSAYERAQVLAPADADVAFNRGHALLNLQRYDEALASYDAALALRPDFGRAHYYRGNILRQLSRGPEAVASFERAWSLDSSQVDVALALGDCLWALDRPQEALTAYDSGLKLAPTNLDALHSRSGLLLTLKRPGEALRDLERLSSIAPDGASQLERLPGSLLNARLQCCDWRDYAASVAAIRNGIENGVPMTAPSIFLAWGDSDELHLRCARDLVHRSATDAQTQPPPPRPQRATRSRLRLAYVSADFADHPVAQLLTPIIEHHDRERFEPIGVALRKPDDSPVAGRLVRAFDHLISAEALSDAQVASTLRELEVDIAIDLMGYTQGSRSGIYRHRAAPIQVNYLGYPGTLAAPFMDYLIADRIVVPEHLQNLCSETVVYLSPCYLPPGDPQLPSSYSLTRAESGLPEHAFVFCCFNSHHKIVPPVFDVWMRLLREVEGSVLWLSAANDAVMSNLVRETSERGVAPDRILFASRLPDLRQHLCRYSLADLFLDTLPYNAHKTARDALWAGLPLLTCRGGSFPGRVAASLLTAVGLPELACESLDDYEALAVRLAQDPSRLRAIRDRLRHQRDQQPPLPAFDSAAYCRQLEAAFLMMQQRRASGRAPTVLEERI
jgi:predicted O-linked N-acetylglucosamine transferase (SPINDLY family)